MRRSTFMVSTLIVVLGGCGSFNNSFNSYPAVMPKPEFVRDPADSPDEPPLITKPVTPPSTPVPATVPEQTKKTCDVSPYIPQGKVPDLPDKEIQAVNGDVYAIEKLERRHINELRAYISERRRLTREARKAFEEKCVTASKY